MRHNDMAEALLLRISGEMNIYRAGELKQTLTDALRASNAVNLDLSQIDEIDSAGVQLIVAARRQAYTTDKQLRIVAHSSAVADALALLSLASCLGIGPDACERCDSLGLCCALAGERA